MLPSRTLSRFVVRNAKESKGKDSKGKKPGGKGGGGRGGGGAKSQGEAAAAGKNSAPAKKAGPRANVWSRDVAEAEYQASRGDSAKNPSSKQNGRSVTAGGGGRQGSDGKSGRGQGSNGNGIAPQVAAGRLEMNFDDDDYTGVVATGGIPVEVQEVLQAPEQMPNPLWPTFVSSNAGVWQGIGAAFSPITAEMEPVALGSSKEYLYDATVLCNVNIIPGPENDKINGTSLHRKVMWKVGNSQGELGYEEFDDDDEFEDDDLEGEGDFTEGEGINAIELASSAIAEGMVYPPEATGEEFGTVEETKAFLQGAEARPEALYNPDKENQECGVLRESDPEWKSMFKAETADAGLVEELRNATVGTAAAVDEAPLANSDNVWTEVMEEDTMTMEPGLVFFSDGSYSRGPVSLVPDDLAASYPGYKESPTFKIEQCLVTGKHKRLRLVHTIAIMESGEEIQVLRVAVYEEQWMGPCNMESISETGGVYLAPFSQRDRLSPNKLTGSWKTFEMSAMAIHQPDASPLTRPAYAQFCQEVMLKQDLPEPLMEYFEEEEESEPISEDPAVLWLPGGITATVQAKEEGILTVGIGWFYDKGTFLAMERDYGPDGKLSEVRSQTKVKGGWAGGRM